MDYTESIYFLDELKASTTFKNAKVYKKNDGVWYEISTDKQVSEPSLLVFLKSQGEDVFSKKKIDEVMYCFFRLILDEMFVALEVSPKIRETRQSSYWEELCKLKKNASHIFFANHDPLTGLLNRNGLRLKIENQRESKFSGGDHETLEEAGGNSRGIVIFSLDIDHFKQINDSNGHAAGDEVLKVFSSTLRDAVEKIKKIFDGIFILSRLGGEEFELIFIGQSNRSQVEKIIDSLFEAIRAPIQAKTKTKASSVESNKKNNLPTSIFCSIGVAGAALNNVDLDKKVVEIRGRSDAALMRAKNDGRNCARFYEDIRSKHGRVIEYHSDSEVVIMDIGRDVGARAGDSYRVYYPPFTGDGSLVKNDGRSSKKIGDYIPISSATVQVVSCQAQMSTAIVIELHTNAPIPVGALLKRIDNGSNPVLYAPRQSGLQIGTAEEFISKLQKVLVAKNLLALLNVAQYTLLDHKLRPDQLSNFSAILAACLPPGTEVFLTSGAAFNVIIKKNSLEIDELEGEISGDEAEPPKRFERLLMEKLNILQETCQCAIGYIPDYHGVFEEDSYYKLIYCARAALHVALASSKDEKRTVRFSPNEVIYHWRKLNSYGDAIADYRQFKRFGINEILLENQFGVTMLSSGIEEYQVLAEVALKNAVDMNSENRIVGLNLATAKVHLEKYDEAHDLFVKHAEYIFKGDAVNAYGVSYGKVLLEMKKARKISYEVFKNLIDKIFREGVPRNYASSYRKWSAEIQTELKAKK
ncbi:GGDEF domain-containing protein [Janthinobacterium lividum]|uniref:GGDEF domain-containing protein n=1 Tax=Janthinobacterium lividum TaxID=29581 RepID=UPI00044A361F|nr:GGDEF domain-containing protein [Janthinobacterium lividum]EZP40539.1 Diguanylate cyclase (GGDEF) domain-containing protein [Janthinobacterium lividum]